MNMTMTVRLKPTSISDVRDGRIYNKTLLGFVLPGIVLCVIYYGYFARDLFWLFMINFGIIALISLILFYTHSFAGGDCKLTLVMAMLYPANEYLVYGKSDVTLYFALCLAILYGYFYLLFFSIYSLVKGRAKITKEYVKGYLGNFLKSFLSASGYICLINLYSFYDVLNKIKDTVGMSIMPVRYVENRDKCTDISLNHKDLLESGDETEAKYRLTCTTKEKLTYSFEEEWRLIYEREKESTDGEKIGDCISFVNPKLIICGKSVDKESAQYQELISIAEKKGIRVLS